MKIWDLSKLTVIGGLPLMPGPREPGLYCNNTVRRVHRRLEAIREEFIKEVDGGWQNLVNGEESADEGALSFSWSIPEPNTSILER